jgi:DNA-binding transcriptional regulator of glucitol operon
VRRFFTPGWLGLHALAIALFSAFLGFGWWQLQRAQEGNDRSWGYVFEWPVFSIFVIVMWIKMMRDELNDDKRPAEVGPAEPVRPLSETELIRQHEAEDENLAAYNRYLARLNAQSPPIGGAGGSSA